MGSSSTSSCQPASRSADTRLQAQRLNQLPQSRPGLGGLQLKKSLGSFHGGNGIDRFSWLPHLLLPQNPKAMEEFERWHGLLDRLRTLRLDQSRPGPRLLPRWLS